MNIDHVFLSTHLSSADTLSGITVERTDHRGRTLALLSRSVHPLGWKSLVDEIEHVILPPAFSSGYMLIVEDETVLDDLPSNVFAPRETFSLMTLAWPFAFTDHVPTLSIQALHTYFGFSWVAQTPGSDAQRLKDVYFALMTRLKTCLAADEVVRGLGGQVLQKARGFLGF